MPVVPIRTMAVPCSFAKLCMFSKTRRTYSFDWLRFGAISVIVAFSVRAILNSLLLLAPVLSDKRNVAIQKSPLPGVGRHDASQAVTYTRPSSRGWTRYHMAPHLPDADSRTLRTQQ